MMNKKFLCIVGLWFLLSPWCAQAESSSDKIIAIVNSDVITQSQFDKKVAIFKQQIEHAGAKAPSLAELHDQVMDNLIYTDLQLQLAKRVGIDVTDAELNTAIENIAKNNKMTLEQLKQSIAQDTGADYNTFRKEIHEQMVIGRVQQQAVGKDVVVSDQEVDAVLANPPKMDVGQKEWQVVDVVIKDSSKKTADQVVTKLRQNADVQQTDSVQANDLGWRKEADLPALFVKVIPNMKAGDVAGPLEAPNGLHVIKVVAIHGGEAPGKLTREQAQELAYHQKMDVRLKQWLKELRAGAYVKIM